MNSPRAVPMSQRMVDVLPDGAYSADCSDENFSECGHWVHSAASGLYAWSPEFDRFIAEKAVQAKLAQIRAHAGDN